MNPVSVMLAARRRHLLCTAGTVLVAVLAIGSAEAQTAGGQATGIHMLVNEQSAPVGAVQAAGGAGDDVTGGALAGVATHVGGNTLSARADGNQSDLSVAFDAITDEENYGPTRLTTGAARVSGDGATVIVNRQDTGSASARAGLSGTSFGLTAGTVTESDLAVSGNAAEAIAAGNDGTAAIHLTGVSTNDGAGIASLQTGLGTAISASARNHVDLATGPANATRLANDDNLVRAIGSGNALDTRLSGTFATLDVPADAGEASLVPFDGDSSTENHADFGLLVEQRAGGTIRAGTGLDAAPVFRTKVDGGLDGSTLSTDGNMAVAAAYANQSANALELAAPSIAGPSGHDGAIAGAVAAITGIQRIADGSSVAASSARGAAVQIGGSISDSTLSASNDVVRTIATGNASSGNRLTVSSATIDQVGGSSGDDAAAGALAGSGWVSTGAAFLVHNLQDYGDASVSASQTGGSIAVAVEGAATGSGVRADDNVALVAATGNSAVNAAGLEAASVRTSAAVNSFQYGDGNVVATIGAGDAPGGSLISAAGPVGGSTLSVSGNSMTGTAIGETATNSLTVAAGRIVNGIPGEGTAGPIGNSQGATATFALANYQKLGQASSGDTLTPTISSSVFGATGVSGGRSIQESSIAVDDNSQRANALGNAAVNRIAVSAATPGEGTAAPGSALFSAQYGQANLSATSTSELAIPAALASSTGSVSNNSNVALSVVNDVDNGLSAEGLQADGGAGIAVASNESAVPLATGANAVANQQSASGSTAANAATRLEADATGLALDRSQLSVSGNTTSAEAAGNRAINAAQLPNSAGQASIALASRQLSLTRVDASAATEIGLGAPTLNGSVIAITANTTSALSRGNAADNELMLAPAGSVSASGVATASAGSASAPVALSNAQINYGAVTATATGGGRAIPLNGPGALQASSLTSSGNSVAASAYGNAATNMITVSGTGRSPGASVANVQANYGSVSAQVTGAVYRGAGPASGASVSITGNQTGAVAIGNQSTSAITAPR